MIRGVALALALLVPASAPAQPAPTPARPAATQAPTAATPTASPPAERRAPAAVDSIGLAPGGARPFGQRRLVQPSLRLDAGMAVRGFFGIGFYGAEAGVGYGARVGSAFAVVAQADVFAGLTSLGVLGGQLRGVLRFEAIFDRVRVGGGPALGALLVRRATQPASPLLDVTVGPQLQLSVDVARQGERAFYLALRTEVDLLAYVLNDTGPGIPVLFGTTIVLGARL